MKIGILGGGQLGRMFIQEALKYDDEFFVLDPSSECSCATISHFTQGDFNDYSQVYNFGIDKDVISIEIEHINTDALFDLEAAGKKIIPSPKIISIIQQKILQKQFYKAKGIPTPDFQIIHTASQANFPLPFVQKMNTGGYDGKGVQIIKTEEDKAKLWDCPSVLETLVDIEKELSIIVAQNESGQVVVF
ncbi:MAG: ATP-grasp domain-containing protein, partial [Bacteroidetes bacterium]|nr:ATP-grasp domain-containing protein [Bacteroidota bacterium]